MVDEPLPDRGHEALRQSILATLADLQQNAADTTDSLTLTDILFEQFGSVLAQIDALQQRVAQLESPLAP
jgi:hypothetical protein